MSAGPSIRASGEAVCFETLQFERDPWSLENYRKVGGYQAWEKILREKPTPDSIVKFSRPEASPYTVATVVSPTRCCTK